MKLKVPFYRQTTPLNCGPTALKMVLAYFGKDEAIGALERRAGIREGEGVSGIQIAAAAALSGQRADFYSKHVLFNEGSLKHEFYRKYSSLNLDKSKKILEEAKSSGVNIREISLSRKKLLSLVTKDSIPIVLLDWNVVNGKKGYQGHFVPVAGYDSKNVYVHNSGLNDAIEFMPIPLDVFDKARKADGTDEDVIVVHRK